MVAKVSSVNVQKNLKLASHDKSASEFNKNASSGKGKQVIEISKKNGTFYLESAVKNISDSCRKKQQYINSQRDKAIEQTKIKMEKQFKEEEARYKLISDKIKKKNEQKEAKIRLKAQKKEEMLLRAEFMAREELCKKEIFEAISKMASEKGWFDTALEMYKSIPELFKKEN